MSISTLCAKCGAPVHKQPGDPEGRLCAVHMREALANTPPFVDGKDTGSTPGCRCDGPCPECPPGKPRKNCRVCGGYGTLCCEMPCWQRLGETSEPCCPGCPPLPRPDAPRLADIVPIGGRT